MNAPDRTASVSHFTPLFLGFGVQGALLVGIFAFLQEQAQTDTAIQDSMAARKCLYRTLLALEDVETGQRGFLLTLDRSFLAPYEGAIADCW